MGRGAAGRLIEAAAVALITLAACALAAYWALLVPIFQSPDEPVHFDYVMTVYDTGFAGLRHPAAADYYQFVRAETRYLSDQSGFLSIAGSPGAHAAPGYRSREYLEELDRGAPAGGGDPATAPFLVSQYAVGYYALAAAWLHLLGPLGLGLTGLFFATRLLSVLMLGVTLPLTYLVTRELGWSRLLGLGLTVAIGLFPLTTFVASYVQADNLAWLLVTLAAYVLLWGRRTGFGMPPLAVLGLVLGLLLVTKLQFFLCVALVAGAAVAAGRPRRAWALLPLPAAVLGGLQTWIAPGPILPFGASVTRTSHRYHISLAPLQSALHQGAAATLGYLAENIRAAFTNFYAGTTEITYWGYFGWLDRPLVIGTASVNGAIRQAILIGTLAMVGLAAAFLARGAARLLARRPGVRETLSRVSADPLLTAYCLFTGLMFAFYVVTHGTFGPQGRNWLPFILPAFAIPAVYAPRLLPGDRAPMMAGALLLGLLIAYAGVGAAVAPGELRSRYYSSGAQVSRAMPGAVPRLARGLTYAVDSSRTWPDVPRESNPTFAGWAVDTAGGGHLPLAASASVDGGPAFPILLGIARPDVAAKLGPAALRSGFAVDFVAATLSLGRHQVALEFLSADGRAIYEPPPIEFTVR